MAKVFISYSRKDTEFAKKLTGELQKSDYDFWIDWEGIPPTVDWWREIEKGIEESDIFLFIISPDSATSKICGQEIDTAVKNGKRIIPVVTREIEWEDTPPQLGHLNYIFFSREDDFNTATKKLLTAIQTDYEWAATHRRFQVKALEWERSEKENSFLLRGKDLQDAEEQLATNTSKEPHPTDLQREYIHKSRQIADRQRRITTGISIVGIIALAILAVYGFVQAGLATANATEAENQAAAAKTAQANAEVAQASAESESRRATAGLLALESKTNLDLYPLRAQLLALEAVFVNHKADEPIQPTAEEALRQANERVTGFGLSGFRNEVSLLEITSDNKWLVAGSSVGEVEGGIKIWDLMNLDNGLPNLVLEYKFPLGEGSNAELLFSQDESWLILSQQTTASEGNIEGKIKVWNMNVVENGTPKLALETDFLPDVDMDEYSAPTWISPDETWLVLNDANETRLWRLETLMTDTKPSYDFDGKITFLESDFRLQETRKEDIIALWELDTPQPGQSKHAVFDGSFIEFAPPNYIYTLSKEFGILRSEYSIEGASTYQVLDRGDGWDSFSFSWSGNLFMAIQNSSKLAVWDVSGDDIAAPQVFEHKFLEVGDFPYYFFSEDEDYIGVASFELNPDYDYYNPVNHYSYNRVQVLAVPLSDPTRQPKEMNLEKIDEISFGFTDKWLVFGEGFFGGPNWWGHGSCKRSIGPLALMNLITGNTITYDIPNQECWNDSFTITQNDKWLIYFYGGTESMIYFYNLENNNGEPVFQYPAREESNWDKEDSIYNGGQWMYIDDGLRIDLKALEESGRLVTSEQPNDQSTSTTTEDPDLSDYEADNEVENLETESLTPTVPLEDFVYFDEAVSMDGKWYVVGTSDGNIRLWNLQEGIQDEKIVSSNRYDGFGVRLLRFTPNGIWLDADDAYQFLQLENGEVNLLPPEEIHPNYQRLFSLNNHWMVFIEYRGDSRSLGYDVNLVNMQTLSEGEKTSHQILELPDTLPITDEFSFTTGVSDIYTGVTENFEVFFSPDNRWIAVTGQTTRLWDLGNKNFSKPYDISYGYNFLKFEPGSHSLVGYANVTDSNNTQFMEVHFWELPNDQNSSFELSSSVKIERSVETPGWPIISNDGHWILEESGSLWDMHCFAKEINCTSFTLDQKLVDVNFDPESNYLYNSSDSGISIWDLQNTNAFTNQAPVLLYQDVKSKYGRFSSTGQAKYIPGGNGGFAVCVSVNGCAGGGGGGGGGEAGSFAVDYGIELFITDDHLSTLKNKIIELRGHEYEVWDYRVSPNGKLAITYSDDSLRLWRLEQFQENSSPVPVILPKLDSEMVDLGFTLDNEWIVVVTNDNHLHIWPVDIHTLIDQTCQSIGRNFIINEWERYFPNKPYQKTCENLPEHPSVLLKE